MRITFYSDTNLDLFRAALEAEDVTYTAESDGSVTLDEASATESVLDAMQWLGGVVT